MIRRTLLLNLHGVRWSRPLNELPPRIVRARCDLVPTSVAVVGVDSFKSGSAMVSQNNCVLLEFS